MKAIIPFLLALACFFFHAATLHAADPVKGNGTLTTKEIAIEDFNEIRLNGPMMFHYEQSDAAPSSIEITLDQNLHSALRLDVKNRILTISFKGTKVESVTQFIVHTRSPWLKAVRLSGNAGFYLDSPLKGDEVKIHAGANCLAHLQKPLKVGKLDLNIYQGANILATDLEAETLYCNMDCSGSLTLEKGTAATASYFICGSGDLHAYGCQTKQLVCSMVGSGLAEITATDRLKISLIGSGTIRYKGTSAVGKLVSFGKGLVEHIQ
ncbi:hypothetical protein Barb4_01575 [Bacteroidales bacterium Barb4]|nr:hypothetical protein Barb4_01575 [Bacteroidales bacterium Barb4]